MKRKVYDTLLKWKKNKEGTALMLEGARRIGKSYMAEELGRNEYQSYLKVDFSIAPEEVFDLFEHYLHDLDTLFERLQLFYGVRLYPGESLLIFDEIQFCPKARAAIKHLVADGRYDYIGTGSLISIKKNVQDILIPSEERTIEMYPMDFEEFLWAVGEDMLMPFIKSQFEKKQPMGGALHRKAIELFRTYMIIGGMPQAVLKYVETRDFDSVDVVKRDILDLYRKDIRKYADGEELRVTAIFDELPGQLQRHERRFKLSSLSSNARMREYSDAFFWLSDAGIVNCCYNSTAPNLGLRLNESRTTLKCYMGDTGLLISMAFDEHGEEIHDVYRKLILGKLEINEGMLVENMVAQMLKCAGHKLYFFARGDNDDASNRMEIDFLISKSRVTSRHNIIPIEVKSSVRYTLSSLRKCMDKFGPYLSTPVVLHDKDVYESGGILYLPLYMTSLL